MRLSAKRKAAPPEQGTPAGEQHKPVFAAGWCAAKIFMVFVLGCLLGTWYEETLHLIKFGEWVSRRGVIYGPFNPVYGLGFALFVILLGKHNDTRKWYLTYLYSALIGGAAEYILNFLQETLLHNKSWDYTGYFLNIGGRTTIPFMLFWGLGGLVFMKWLYPVLSMLIEKIPYQFGRRMLPVLVVFMCADMFISYTALFRQSFRHEGKPPATILGQIYDQVYTDAYLEQVFPNMEFEKPERDLSEPQENGEEGA